MFAFFRPSIGFLFFTLLLSACREPQPPNGEAVSEKAPLSKQEPAKPQLVKEEEPSVEATEQDISPEYLMGKFTPKEHPLFDRIPSRMSSREMYLRKEALAAFEKMHQAAKKDGIELTIISATRPFHHQKSIWEAKWQGKRQVDGELLSPTVKDTAGRATRILRWSSMPGTSRHHWGTDIDINDLNNSYFESGKGKKEYAWLVAHAGDYGFCQVYSAIGKKRPYGYQEEKWHWSYLPIAQKLTRAYKDMIRDGDIKGFAGAESAPKIEVVKKYVLGINPDCE